MEIEINRAQGIEMRTWLNYCGIKNSDVIDMLDGKYGDAGEIFLARCATAVIEGNPEHIEKFVNQDMNFLD